MRKVAVQPLTMEAFRPYGDFVSLLKTGDGAPGFYPDLLQLPLGQAVTTVGLARIQAGRVADMLEYHWRIITTPNSMIQKNGKMQLRFPMSRMLMVLSPSPTKSTWKTILSPACVIG